MTNLSYLSKAKIGLILTVIISLTILLNKIYYNNQELLINSSIIAILTALYSFYCLNRASKFLLGVSKVCKDVRKGNFESRVINLNQGSELKVLADSVNSSIDICDAFVRESMLAMKAASQGKFYRKIRPEGMEGMFSHSVNGINDAIDFLKDKDEADKKNQEMVNLTINNIDELISNASSGNLNKKASTDGLDENYGGLIEKMNGLMEVVEKPLLDIMNVLNSLSEGDLTRKIESDYEGVFDEIKTSVNNTIQKLSDITSKIKDSQAINRHINKVRFQVPLVKFLQQV